MRLLENSFDGLHGSDGVKLVPAKLEIRSQKLEMGEAKLETGKLGEERLLRGPILWRESEGPELGAARVKFERDFVQGR